MNTEPVSDPATVLSENFNGRCLVPERNSFIFHALQNIDKAGEKGIDMRAVAENQFPVVKNMSDTQLRGMIDNYIRSSSQVPDVMKEPMIKAVSDLHLTKKEFLDTLVQSADSLPQGTLGSDVFTGTKVGEEQLYLAKSLLEFGGYTKPTDNQILTIARADRVFVEAVGSLTPNQIHAGLQVADAFKPFISPKPVF
jgi:hypothetical protein